MNNLDSAFSRPNIECQNQSTRNASPAISNLDDLTNQMNDFSIERTQGDILHDIGIIERVKEHMDQTHSTLPVSNIPRINVQQLERRAREVADNHNFAELVEGLEQVYREPIPFMVATIQQSAWTVRNFNGLADGAKRRTWLRFAGGFEGSL